MEPDESSDFNADECIMEGVINSTYYTPEEKQYDYIQLLKAQRLTDE